MPQEPARARPTDDPLFPAASWPPLPRPGGKEDSLAIVRVEEPSDKPPLPGPQVLARDGERAWVRLRFFEPTATEVALQANGWWRPAPVDACDLRPTGDGWWEAIFEVPADWRASYGFAIHRGQDGPPWWSTGLKAPGAEIVHDPGNPRSHTAGRGGARRSLLSLPDDGPFTLDAATAEAAEPALQELPTAAGEPRVLWWAPGPGQGGGEGRETAADLPLLIVTDGSQHTEGLCTPALLARAVTEGALPPLAAVFVEATAQRGEVLGVPGGQARWIAEQLVPRLRAEGLGDGAQRISVTSEASRTIISGSSFGGLTALFAAARSPEHLGAVIAQSTSLWRYPEGALVEPLARAARAHPLRLRLHAGRYEGSMPALSRSLHDALAAEEIDGLELSLAVHSGGHDWAWWQPTMLQELASLLR